MSQVYGLIHQIHQGDKKAREQMIMDNMGLVVSAAGRFTAFGHEREELIQIGSIGLMKAIDHFDTSYGVCFSTYAVPMICGEIKRFLRDDGPMKVSRSIMENQRLISQKRQELEEKLGQAPSLSQLEDATGLSSEDIILAQGVSAPVESIYQTMYESEGSQLQLIDMLPLPGKSLADTTVDQTVLKEAMEQLDTKERLVIIGRYYERITQSKLAQRLEMTQVQVSRMEKRALLKMRASILGEKVV